MEFLRLRALAVLLLALGGIAFATTRYTTDEIVNEDGGPVAFPGGITVPTEALYPSSTATFYSSGTYSATITGVTNTDDVTTPATLRYDRIGDYIHVWGRVGVDPTAASATLTTFRIALPAPPLVVFSSTGLATGTAGVPVTATNGVCSAETSAYTVACTYGAVSAGGDLLNVNFTYKIQ